MAEAGTGAGRLPWGEAGPLPVLGLVLRLEQGLWAGGAFSAPFPPFPGSAAVPQRSVAP